jgi:hypothetical protein
MEEPIMNQSDLVYINLDRPRNLRFGHKALKKLTALTGMDVTKMDISKFEFEDLEKIFYCGLLTDARENNETLKLEDMEDLLDQADSYQELMDKMLEAFENSFGSAEQKNVQRIVEKKNP